MRAENLLLIVLENQHYMRMTVLLLSLIEAVMRPGAQPLLHSASCIILFLSFAVCCLPDSLRCLFSSRSHLHHYNIKFTCF